MVATRFDQIWFWPLNMDNFTFNRAVFVLLFFHFHSMLKSLLFSAKIKFVSASHNSGLEQCEIYLDRVNLLDLLVTHNCVHIPSVQQLTKIDVVRYANIHRHSGGEGQC